MYFPCTFSNKWLTQRSLAAAPLDLVHPGYNREHYQHQLSPLDGSGRQPLMPPFLGFGFGGFSWGVPPTPTLSGAPQGTGRGMFAKLFDWKSPVRLDKPPGFFNTALMRGATDLVPCITREHGCYKGRVCTSVARGRRSVYTVAERRV